MWKAEVYSRITGYYRPVQNWNDGKAQEYKNRTLYDVLHSKLKKVHTSMVTVTDDDVKIEPVETHKYLFTTNTCPNCRMAKKMMEGEDLRRLLMQKNPDMASVWHYAGTDTGHYGWRTSEEICKCIQYSEISWMKSWLD